MGEERSGWLHSPGASALRYISDGEHTLWPTFRHRPRGQRSNCARLCYVGGYEQLVTTVHLFFSVVLVTTHHILLVLV